MHGHGYINPMKEPKRSVELATLLKLMFRNGDLVEERGNYRVSSFIPLRGLLGNIQKDTKVLE